MATQGVQIVTTVLTAASTYDLTDLATVRDELSIPTSDTSSDAFLSRAITQVSSNISNYCNRIFNVETIQDVIYPDRDRYPYQVPGGLAPLQLSRWPLVKSEVVALTGSTHTSTLVDSLSTTTGLVTGTLIFGDGIPIGDTVAGFSTMTNYLTLATAATATADLVALNTGLFVSVAQPPGVTTTLVADTDFTIDKINGWLIRLHTTTLYPRLWDPAATTVIYQAGYSTIPGDLVDATLRLVTQRYSARGRDPMIRSRDQPGLGSTSYWVGSTPGSGKGAFPPEIAGILDNYRVPITA